MGGRRDEALAARWADGRGKVAMPGALVLAGSGEFLPPMIPVDEEVLRHTPGTPSKVAILPTAAGLEDVTPWIENGIKHFTHLGGEAYGVRAVDRPGVEDPAHVAALEAADLIYLSGGSPGHLVETLRGSVAWDAIVRVWKRGGTLAGSSAGAMALGEWTLVRRADTAGWMP
jgi:cyanophycinase